MWGGSSEQNMNSHRALLLMKTLMTMTVINSIVMIITCWWRHDLLGSPTHREWGRTWGWEGPKLSFAPLSPSSSSRTCLYFSFLNFAFPDFCIFWILYFSFCILHFHTIIFIFQTGSSSSHYTMVSTRKKESIQSGATLNIELVGDLQKIWLGLILVTRKM